MMAQPMNDRPDFLEQHYTIGELGLAWNVSTKLLCRWFLNEPDVLRVNVSSLKRTGKRRPYISLRVPGSVARRVYFQNMNQPAPGLPE